MKKQLLLCLFAVTHSFYLIAQKKEADVNDVEAASHSAVTNDPFKNLFKEMEDHFRSLQEHVRQGIQGISDSAHINLEESKKGVLITIKGIETDKVQATSNDENNNLLIKTGEGDINITTQDNFITIDWQHKKEEQKKNKEGKTETVLVSASHNSYNMMLARSINIGDENIEIDYDKATKILSIEIPYVKAPQEQRKAIPVTIKGKTNKK
jgi:hypothetical protein